MADKSGREMPEVGQRVVLTGDVDRFDAAYVRAGAAGEVVRADADQVEVRLDETHPGLSEWDNCLIWYAEMHVGEGETLAEAFWAQAAPEEPAPRL